MLAPLSLAAAERVDRLSDKNRVLLAQRSICALCPSVWRWVSLIWTLPSLFLTRKNSARGREWGGATRFLINSREGLLFFNKVVLVTLNLTYQYKQVLAEDQKNHALIIAAITTTWLGALQRVVIAAASDEFETQHSPTQTWAFCWWSGF